MVPRVAGSSPVYHPREGFKNAMDAMNGLPTDFTDVRLCF